MTISDYKLKLKAAIEARGLASNYDFEQCDQHPMWIHRRGKCSGPEITLCTSFGDAKFFALAANNLKQICESQLKLIDAVEKSQATLIRVHEYADTRGVQGAMTANIKALEALTKED